jgi:hypothetical protein
VSAVGGLQARDAQGREDLVPQGREPRLAAQRNCGTASSLAKSMQESQSNVADSQRKTGTYMKGN